MRGKLVRVAVALTLTACGASSGGGSTTPGQQARGVDPPAFLEEVGAASSPVLRRPERSIDELEQARRDARGAERRQAARDLVIGLMFAAADAEDREARRHRRRAERIADAAARGSRDRGLAAELDFAKLWMAWQSGSRAAERRAERFTIRHRQAGDLLTLAWMLRGEIALADERYDDAVEAYRFALGQLGHPLYAFALLRTAHAQRRRGNADQADQALAEVEQLGCAPDASPAVVRLAAAAASERGSGIRLDTDGVTRPAACPTPDESADEEDEGWRPAE